MTRREQVIAEGEFLVRLAKEIGSNDDWFDRGDTDACFVGLMALQLIPNTVTNALGEFRHNERERKRAEAEQ